MFLISLDILGEYQLLKSTGAEAPQTSNASHAISRDTKTDLVRIGVIGYGYWGPNIVRNFHAQERSRVVAVCDKNAKSLQRSRQEHPDVPVTQECADLLEAPDIDVACIVTPVWTHYELAKAALENGKH